MLLSQQFYVTGSSSFNLLNNTEEMLTGRKFVYNLYPFSITEIRKYNQQPAFEFKNNLNNFLLYGSYPEIFKTKNQTEKKERLQLLAGSYLYQDILEFNNVKNPNILIKLLRALALQIGQLASINELANLLDINRQTVERYIDLLEKNYIIFQLRPYTFNKRREIAKSRKIYFYDLGIRNMLIENFTPLENRQDKGNLFENFLVLERLKHRNYHKLYANTYFWRTYDGSEVDLIEEYDGELHGYEFKFNNKTPKPPLAWQNNKEKHTYNVINQNNWLEWLTD